MDPSRRQFEYMQLQINDAQATVDRQRELLEEAQSLLISIDLLRLDLPKLLDIRPGSVRELITRMGKELPHD